MSIVIRSPQWVIFYIFLLCFSMNLIDADCPSKGKVGGKQVPDALAIEKDQKGYTATIEIITPEEESIMITETYNSAKQYGIIEINELYKDQTSKIYYYLATKEKYEIDDSSDCASSTLETEDKYEVINSWIKPESAKDEIDLFGKLDILGPTVLLTYATKASDRAQYVGSERIDGRTVDHWFYCLTNDIVLDWYFETSTSLPFRFSLGSAKNLTEPHIYNFLIFTPVANTISDVVQYPIGYGCYREAKDQPKFPEFGRSDSFSMDAEAMIMYTKPDGVVLSSLRLIKYQDTFSYELSDGPNTTRIIQNPDHMGRYVIKGDTGECNSEYAANKDTNGDDIATKWPYHKDLGFNLIVIILPESATWTNYMGQVPSDSGLMDVWELDLYGFFEDSSKYHDVSVTYYFPVIDRTKNPKQAPSKIVIAPHKKEYISSRNEVPYQIEVVIIDYAESDFDLEDRFDVSGCYDGPGEFTWFQIVMSDTSAASYSKDLAYIRSYFEKTLETFIPKIRIPEVAVNLYDFNYYITAKLLERPPFKFYFQSIPGDIISNPTSVLVRDNLEDCGEICNKDTNCKGFSYCNDLTCQVFSAGISYQSIEPNENCTWYSRQKFDLPTTLIGRNTYVSTKNILSQIKSKVNAGEFILTKYSLSAEDMFIVSGPEEIGGIEEEFDDSAEKLHGDEYTVISANSRLTIGEKVDAVSYSDCLKLCQNDDDCYTLSYCFNQHEECILSNETKAILTKDLSSKTSHADKCDVFEKSFMTFYRRFPGQSLVKDAIATLPDIDESECARRCYESTDFPCKSFDFCLALDDTSKGAKTDCFLHQFHAVEDTAHEIKDKVWDFSKSHCDHYAVRLSRDYTHYLGQKYKQGAVSVLKEITDVSLERCAADCNSDEGYCTSFEYCENTGSSIKSSCRLASSNDNPNNYESFDSNSRICAVYLNKAKVSRKNTSKSSDHFGLAMGLGSFFFIVAFAAGIVGSIYYKRRF